MGEIDYHGDHSEAVRDPEGPDRCRRRRCHSGCLCETQTTAAEFGLPVMRGENVSLSGLEKYVD